MRTPSSSPRTITPLLEDVKERNSSLHILIFVSIGNFAYFEIESCESKNSYIEDDVVSEET